MADQPIQPLKACTKCGVEKRWDEFYQRKDRAGAKQPCKTCFAELSRQRYERRIELQGGPWRLVCADCGVDCRRPNPKSKRCPACQAAHTLRLNAERRKNESAESRAKRKATAQAYKRANRERGTQLFWEWRQRNAERIKEKRLALKAENPLLLKYRSWLNRARRSGVKGTFTLSDFIELCEKMKWVCPYCGDAICENTVTLDHKIPTSRGGTNDVGNIWPCCKPCNNKKYNRTVEEFIAVSASRWPRIYQHFTTHGVRAA